MKQCQCATKCNKAWREGFTSLECRAQCTTKVYYGTDPLRDFFREKSPLELRTYKIEAAPPATSTYLRIPSASNEVASGVLDRSDRN